MTLVEPPPPAPPAGGGPGRSGEDPLAATPAPATEPRASADDGPVRLRLLVAYDGSGFRGFAAQGGVRTVAGTLAEALTRVVGHPVELTCAGRTDAGVHAWGQVVTCDVEARAVDDLHRLQGSLNRLCGPEVVVRDLGVAPAGFDARFSAVARTYRYTVLTTPVPDPFRVHTVWHVPGPLDLRAMWLACDPLIGEHDFSSFCRAGVRADGTPAPLVRRVHDARWVDPGDGTLQFRIRASSFCQQMVRALVGTLVEVGRGRRRAGEMTGIIAARDRNAAGQLAPPTGLCLWTVDYPDGWSAA
jgi:tRNA pseudouridine38-40 synthase